MLITCPMQDFSLLFVIKTDACAVGVGAVLMQVGCPLAYTFSLYQ